MKRIDNKFKKYIGVILCILCCFNSFQVWAGESTAKESPVGFTVEAIIPENQVDKTKSYFYISMRPDQKQKVQVKIKSTRKEPALVSISLTNAVTGDNGTIDYGKKNPALDESLEVPLTDLVTIKEKHKKITVKNFEEKTVEFEVKTPKKKFAGVKLGAIRIMSSDQQETNSTSTGVTSEYGYTVAFMLTEDNKDFKHGADLKLKLVSPQVEYGQKVIAAKIQNDQPKVLKDLTMEAEITKKDQDVVLKERKMEHMSIAPNSNFNFLVQWGMGDITPGIYTMHLKAAGDDRTWQWDEDFEITGKAAQEINEESVYKVVVPRWVPVTVAILVIILITLVVYLFLRRKKWNCERTGLTEGGMKDEENR